MKAVVCCKGVPKGIKEVKLLENKGTVECKSFSFQMNECDEYALDAALVWKKEVGMDVTALTMGGIRSQDVLYMAMAKGADQAIRLDAEATDSGVAAQVIAEAVRGKGYDLIVTGVESEDNMASQVAISLAERLGLPYALAVIKVEFLGDQRIKATIELGGGIQEELEITLPAVLATQSGIATLTYAPMAKILRARKTPISSMGMDEIGINWPEVAASCPRIISVFDPPQTGSAEIIGGTLAEIAEKMVERIKNVL